MKKVILSLGILMMLAIVGCTATTSSSQVESTTTETASLDSPDGIYYVEGTKSIFGWRPYTEITVKNGDIVEVKHNRKNKDGELASLDEKYNTSMKKKQGTNPAEFTVSLVESFWNANQDETKIDDIAGATDSSEQFRSMVTFLKDKISKNQPGNYQMDL